MLGSTHSSPSQLCLPPGRLGASYQGCIHVHCALSLQSLGLGPDPLGLAAAGEQLLPEHGNELSSSPLVSVWQNRGGSHGRRTFWVKAHRGWGHRPAWGPSDCLLLPAPLPDHPVTLARSLSLSALLLCLRDCVSLPVSELEQRGGRNGKFCKRVRALVSFLYCVLEPMKRRFL